MNDIFEERFKVCTWDVDQTDRLTMAAVYNYCQEAAGHHAADLGVGAEYMKANGIVWVLSRMSAVLDSRPGWGARLRVRTWPRGTDRLFARRDYEILDEADTIVARGRSGWLIVDASTFRPRRPEALATGLPTNDGRDSLPNGAFAISASEGLEKIMDRTVAYSDLDSNGHMNNARYVQWIQDAVDPDELASASALRLDINYLAEMKVGASAGILGKKAEAVDGGTSRYTIEGRLTDGGSCSFRSELSLGAGNIPPGRA